MKIKDDWRLFRAKLVSQEKNQRNVESSNKYFRKNTNNEYWAHQISQPERGSLLVAREYDMAIFTKSVVLILESMYSNY